MGGIRIAAFELPHYALIGVRRFREEIIFPFPLTSRTSEKHNLKRHKLRVGVLTSFRREQRSEELIDFLYRVCSDEKRNWELAVASRSLGHLNSVITKVDVPLPLESDEDYWNAIGSFDVIVLFYDRTGYEHRPSGIIADAIGCAVPVICPDYPMMVRQVNWPVRIGLVYQDLAQVPALISEITTWSSMDISAASMEHRRLRGRTAYDKIMDSLA
jgi:hypothetical protein